MQEQFYFNELHTVFNHSEKPKIVFFLNIPFFMLQELISELIHVDDLKVGRKCLKLSYIHPETHPKCRKWNLSFITSFNSLFLRLSRP